MPLGKASVLRKGEKLTIITYGAGVHWALETLNEMEIENIELIDLRSLQPLDKEAIISSVKKTGKALVLTEDSLFGSLASEISAIISEECFEFLDAPVMRLGSGETPIPFATAIEDGYLPKKKLKAKIQQLIDY